MIYDVSYVSFMLGVDLALKSNEKYLQIYGLI